MPDGYQPKVYREQGGDRLVVASGGEIEVQSGGLITGDGFVVGAVDDVTIEINGSDQIALKEVPLEAHALPLTSWVGPTGLVLTATETAGSFNRAVSSHALVLKGEVTDNETEVSVAIAELVLPANYVAGGDITIRIRTALIKTGSAVDNGSTIDLSAYKQGDGAVGSDLVTTAAQSFAAVDTWYSKDFVIDATGLVAGDRLTLELTTSIVDSEAGGGTLICNIARTTPLIDVRA